MDKYSVNSKSYRYKPVFVAFFLLIFSIVEINAPIIAYGSQILGFGLIILSAYMTHPKISISVFLFFFLILALMALLSIGQYSHLEYRQIFWLNTLRTLFWVGCAILMYDYISKKLNISSLKNILKIAIILSAFMVILQFISFYVLDLELDLSKLLGGTGVRSLYSGYSEISYRPTGLTSEPAIHSGIMFGLLTLYYILNKNIDWSVLLGIISILLTFSTLGVLLAFTYILITYTSSFSKFLLGIIILILLGFLFQDYLLQRIESFSSGNDGSNNVKLAILDYFLSNSNIFLTGLGFVGKDSNAPAFYEALYDMTYYFTPFIQYGIFIGSLVLLISLCLILHSSFSFKEKALISFALVKLSGPTFLFFNFFVMFLFVLHRNRRFNLS
ncbi:hypothetical protein A4G20_03005 [Pasteurellaceae bacterium RH1A]|nr:hypothetical protein A4G20_03005 [Pasteurellaceae bacterium RH1A]